VDPRGICVCGIPPLGCAQGRLSRREREKRGTRRQPCAISKTFEPLRTLSITKNFAWLSLIWRMRGRGPEGKIQGISVCGIPPFGCAQGGLSRKEREKRGTRHPALAHGALLIAKDSGAEARFISGALRGAEASLFHSGACGREGALGQQHRQNQQPSRNQNQQQSQRQRTGVSAPHEQWCGSRKQVLTGLGARFGMTTSREAGRGCRAALDGQPGAAVRTCSSSSSSSSSYIFCFPILLFDFHSFISSDVHMTLPLIPKWEYWK
jgi:hypothetical protein